MQDQLLHAPIDDLGYDQGVLRGTCQGVNPPECLHLLAGLAEHSEQLTVQAEFVDAPRERIGGIKHLMRRRRNADNPRGAWF